MCHGVLNLRTQMTMSGGRLSSRKLELSRGGFTVRQSVLGRSQS
jgi:hypothetical protein